MTNEEPKTEVFSSDERLTLALETAPFIAVPDSFAARVMSNLPKRRGVMRVPTSLPSTHYGRNTMLACTLLLCILLIASAIATPRESVALLVAQWIFFAQLACLALGFTMRPRRR